MKISQTIKSYPKFAWLVGLAGIILIIGLYASARVLQYISGNLDRLSITETAQSMKSIEAAINSPIPDDAILLQTNIQTINTGSEIGFLDLVFEASSESVSTFVKNYCMGILYEHYDPFNAIDIRQLIESDDVIFIESPISRYTSYSLLASATVSGNRCFNNNGSAIFISVDKSDATMHLVHLQYFHACSLRCIRDGLDEKPIPEFPLIVRGMTSDTRGIYHLFRPASLCMDVDPLAFHDASLSWSKLIRASVQFDIDGKALPPANISEFGLLTPQGVSDRPNYYFNYCYVEDWQDGLHTVTINILTESGEEIVHSWSFILG